MSASEVAVIAGSFTTVIVVLLAAARWIFRHAVDKIVDDAFAPLADALQSVAQQQAVQAQINASTTRALGDIQRGTERTEEVLRGIVETQGEFRATLERIDAR